MKEKIERSEIEELILAGEEDDEDYDLDDYDDNEFEDGF